MRYPTEFRRGAFTHPDAPVRQRAIDLTIEAGAAAAALGADELVIWSAFCGYDYPLQADYLVMWERMVAGFRAVCDAHPTLKARVPPPPAPSASSCHDAPHCALSLSRIASVVSASLALARRAA